MNKLLPFFCIATAVVCTCCNQSPQKIDRHKVVERNNFLVTAFDPFASMSVGNGNFAFTTDATGLQSFPELYKEGVPLGTQSQWGWHSFPNTENYRQEEVLQDYDFGRGRKEPYAVQFNEPGRKQQAANYFRANPHRLHLGYIGLDMTDPEGVAVTPDKITSIEQKLDMWCGKITSCFSTPGSSVEVQTLCHPQKDMVSARISSPLIATERLSVKFSFPYPTGQHADDATDWNHPNRHSTVAEQLSDHSVLLKRTIDTTIYYIRITWEGAAKFEEKQPHLFTLTPSDDNFAFSALFSPTPCNDQPVCFTDVAKASSEYWQKFWNEGAFVDFSACTDKRASELERRVFLSQYLMAIQCAGMYPPQETGLTYNSWFGKFHLEMHWWHAVHFALWNRPELLERSLDWYFKAEPIARQIARRQGFEGIRWMKMTDPSALEAPSKVGSFLIWQQPHFIYMAELIYRNKQNPEVIEKYKDLVFRTADFMASFATYDPENDRYILKGVIPAQETLKASQTINPPFELSYWHYALGVAQQWRERAGLPRKAEWDEIRNKLAPLAQKEGLYLAAETAPDTYENIRYISDHPAVLGAVGILPESRLADPETMKTTLSWIWDNWNWDQTWGWDYPMTAMCAARIGEPEKAVDALLMDKRTNTYLPNGHNYQNARLRIYLPGNGGLLTAVAMMCAGWDGSEGENPGFPDNGQWNVKWEGLRPMP